MDSQIAIAFLAFVFCCQFSASNGAIMRAKVKLGAEFRLENVPGKLVVKRVTSAHPEEQYLFAGECSKHGWTTNGSNRIGAGDAELDFGSGTLVLRNFSARDVGSYSFPMEPEHIHPNGQGGVATVGQTVLVIELDEQQDEEG